MEELLTDAEITKIEQFNKDEVMVEAIRKVLLFSIYNNGTLRKGKKAKPLQNGALSMVSLTGKAIITNEQLGEDLRGLYQGIQLLEAGLNRLSKIKIKVLKINNEEINEAV